MELSDVKTICNDIELHDLQCEDVVKMAYQKRCLITYATGLGKTVLACACMKLLLSSDTSRRFIFLGKHDQLAQTPKKMRNMLGVDVLALGAEKKDVKTLVEEGHKYPVIFLTHDIVYSNDAMNYIFRERKSISGIFVDEIHCFSNVEHSQGAAILSGMSKNFEFFYGLTATPIVSDVKQMARLAVMIDNDRFGTAQKLYRGLSSGNFRIEDDPMFFINRSREEFGSKAVYNGIVEWVEPLPHQVNCSGGYKMFEVCKGEGAYPQREKLVNICKERSNQRGLVYVNQHSVRDWIIQGLDAANINYACVNGHTSMAERAVIMHKFNEEKSIDVVLTSVTTALDLDCDYVVFYEFTVEVKQMIGRAHRGLGDKVLDIIFVLTNNSPELDYFYDNIYKISMEVQNILHQDMSELEDVDREVRARVGS